MQLPNCRRADFPKLTSRARREFILVFFGCALTVILRAVAPVDRYDWSFHDLFHRHIWMGLLVLRRQYLLETCGLPSGAEVAPEVICFWSSYVYLRNVVVFIWLYCTCAVYVYLAVIECLFQCKSLLSIYVRGNITSHTLLLTKVVCLMNLTVSLPQTEPRLLSIFVCLLRFYFHIEFVFIKWSVYGL